MGVETDTQASIWDHIDWILYCYGIWVLEGYCVGALAFGL